MYFLNLTFLQFLTVFGSVSAISVALYLLDRTRRRQVVSTLRFWVAAEQPAFAARKRHVNQLWSLVLQLAGMALLLLAVAQMRIGSSVDTARDHVIILDTSAWMGARSGRGTLMDVARQRARQYLRALPSRDRVMLVRADGLVTPATAFEPDHRKIDAAIQASEPGSTALNLEQALAFARHIQSQDGRRAGEVAFIGSEHISTPESALAPAPPRDLRVIPVQDAVENCGLRKIGLRRSSTEPDLWEIYVSAHNYGSAQRTVTVALEYGPPQVPTRVAAGTARLTLQPGADGEASFTYRTAAAGILGVTLLPHDAFPRDDRTELELPGVPNLNVTVYSNEPDLLRPMLSATPRVTAVYRKPQAYTANDTGLVILDRFVPPQRPVADSIWIDPPAQGSPIPVRASVTDVPFAGWSLDHPAAAGLRAKDFKLARVSVFEASPTDGRIGEVADGPVIVARDNKPKVVVMGFHPALSAMRYELATPILFANLLRWFSPEIFRRSELSGESVGTVKLDMDKSTPAANVKVTAADGSPIPFTLHDRSLHFFAGAPGGVRVLAGDKEYLYSLTLPQLWDTKWTPPPDARVGIPRLPRVADSITELWPWLALLGGGCLLAEWLLFARFRRSAGTARPILIRLRDSVGSRR